MHRLLIAVTIILVLTVSLLGILGAFEPATSRQQYVPLFIVTILLIASFRLGPHFAKWYIRSCVVAALVHVYPSGLSTKGIQEAILRSNRFVGMKFNELSLLQALVYLQQEEYVIEYSRMYKISEKGKKYFLKDA